MPRAARLSVRYFFIPSPPAWLKWFVLKYFVGLWGTDARRHRVIFNRVLHRIPPIASYLRSSVSASVKCHDGAVKTPGRETRTQDAETWAAIHRISARCVESFIMQEVSGFNACSNSPGDKEIPKSKFGPTFMAHVASNYSFIKFRLCINLCLRLLRYLKQETN